jgi:hypothetical protein
MATKNMGVRVTYRDGQYNIYELANFWQWNYANGSIEVGASTTSIEQVSKFFSTKVTQKETEDEVTIVVLKADDILSVAFERLI